MTVLGLLMAVAIVGCDDDDDDGGGGGGSSGSVSGAWHGTGNYKHNNVPITDFTMNLTQSGNSVSGSYSIKRDARPTMSGSVSGSVNGNKVDLTMGPHGHAEGAVSGNSMGLYWYESGFGGSEFTGPRDGTVNLTR